MSERRIMTEPCEGCGFTGKPYHGRGFCAGCYKRQHRKDPAQRERDRVASRRWKDQHRDENRARDREFVARPENRGNCTTCGGPMGIAVKEDGVCAGCIAEQHELRWQRIEAMWAMDDSMKVIAAALGTTVNVLAVDINRMRKAGRAVPYRYLSYQRSAA